MSNKKNDIFRITVFVAIFAMITACSDSMDMPEMTPDDEKGNVTISFRANSPRSRAGYDGLKSWFEEGDLIGCVIAKKTGTGENATYEYEAKSKWEYREDGFLILKGLKNSLELAEDIRTSQIICIDSKKKDDSYLKLQKTYDYAFFFYYPYIDDEIIQYDFNSHNRDDVVNPYCPLFIPGNPNWDSYHEAQNIQKTMLVGEVAETADYVNGDKLTRYAWTNYPVCVSPTQNTKEKANASDFMYTNYIIDQATLSENIDKDNANYKVDLVFQKKNATIEVQSDVPLSDVTFSRKAAYQEPIVQCKHIDLTTGLLESYDGWKVNGKNYGSYLPSTNGNQAENNTWNAYNNWNYYLGKSELKGELLQRYCTYGEVDHEDNEYYFPPKLMNYRPWNYSGDYRKYRIILPPQNFSKDYPLILNITLNNKTISLDLENKISEIEENKLYIIRIDRKSNIEILINDWIMGTITEIEEMQ